MKPSINSVLHATEAEINEIKKYHNKSDKEVEDDILYLRNWLLKQPHLPQNIDDLYLIKLLRMNKFSLEKCKRKIDMYYSIKNVTPEIFFDRDLLSPKMQDHMDNIMLCPLPKLTKDYSRIHIFGVINNKPEKFDLQLHTNLIFAMADLRFSHDECLTDQYIVDLGNASLGHVLKHNFVDIKKGSTIVEKAYSDRIQGVHFINLPNFANVMVTFAKTILNAKMAKRVHVHKDFESLHKLISKEILPVEYGGTEKSIYELNNNWRKVLEENNDKLLEIGFAKSDEKLRIGKAFEADIFGSIEGSFRQLNVD